MADRRTRTAEGGWMGLTTLGDPVSERRVVLFHPTPGASGFDPVPAVTRHEGVCLLSFDRPGWGASDPLPDGAHASFADHADEVARYLHETDAEARRASGRVSGPIGVIGWGAGARAALSLAGRHPSLVDRLVLVDAPAHAGRLRVGDPPFRPTDLGIADRAGYDVAPGSERRIERMLAEAGRRGRRGLDFDRAAMRTRDWRDTLRDIRARTLLVYSVDHPDTGPVVDGWVLRRRIPGSTLVRVENAGALTICAVWPRILAHAVPRRAA